MNFLKARRFPTLTRAEKTFRTEMTGLNLPERVKIDHPPFFEASNYRLEILFRNGRDLKSIIDTLIETDGLEKITDPWKDNP